MRTLGLRSANFCTRANNILISSSYIRFLKRGKLRISWLLFMTTALTWLCKSLKYRTDYVISSYFQCVTSLAPLINLKENILFRSIYGWSSEIQINLLNFIQIRTLRIIANCAYKTIVWENSYKTHILTVSTTPQSQQRMLLPAALLGCGGAELFKKIVQTVRNYLSFQLQV